TARHLRGRSTSRQAPGAPAVRPQTFGDGATREPSKLSELANSERFELLVAVAFERKKRERERCEELRQLLVGDHDYLPGPRDRSCRQCGEPPPRRADACVPLRPDGSEGTLQRRLETAIEPFDSLGLEMCHAAGRAVHP